MNNRFVAFLVGLLLGMQGIKWFIHAFYILTIAALLYTR